MDRNILLEFGEGKRRRETKKTKVDRETERKKGKYRERKNRQIETEKGNKDRIEWKTEIRASEI